MAEEEVQTLTLNDDFYRDSFIKFVSISFFFCVCIVVIIAASIYLVITKPPPITFQVNEDWRVVKLVPVNEPYLTESNMLQWVSDVLPKVFVFDFLSYNDQLKEASSYFTTDGWQVFLNQLNNYVNYNKVQTDRMFVNAAPTGAPSVLNKGLISGRYGWWVEMPIEITYVSEVSTKTRPITLHVLVVRVPTKNNLDGVGIDNVIIAKDVTGLGAG